MPKNGSPPHVWGNLPLPLQKIRLLRFTPTRVGKSFKLRAASNLAAVHPHTCGEISHTSAIVSALSGSPPHVWGNPTWLLAYVGCYRFTPTRVGKSCDAAYCIAAKAGSPPHVWGNHLALQTQALLVRFTPTRVGKSSFMQFWMARATVHPHTCGEIYE